jgi:hypothetical protein
MLSPGKITGEEFDEALGRYPALVKSISTSKTRKSVSYQILEDSNGYKQKMRVKASLHLSNLTSIASKLLLHVITRKRILRIPRLHLHHCLMQMSCSW